MCDINNSGKGAFFLADRLLLIFEDYFYLPMFFERNLSQWLEYTIFINGIYCIRHGSAQIKRTLRFKLGESSTTA